MRDNPPTQSMVIIAGGFDDLQTIDIRFLQEAQQLGELHVFLYSDQAYVKCHGFRPKFNRKERQYYLGAIRYVDQLSVTDSCTPESIFREINPQQTRGKMFWAVRENDADPEIKQRLAEQGIQYHVIPDASLKGFPIETDEDPIEQTHQKKVMVSGCFDWVHSGHVRFFEEASAYGDLIVVVGHDANLRLLKGEGHPLFPEAQRLYWVQSIRFVKKAVLSSGHGWLDAQPEIIALEPDIFIVNEDGDRPEKRDFLEKQGVEYIVLKREPKPGLPRRESTNLRGF